MRAELEELSRRYGQARAALGEVATRGPTKRAKELAALQIFVRDVELAVRQARARHDADHAVEAVVDRRLREFVWAGAV
jgi:hypothetical protein